MCNVRVRPGGPPDAGTSDCPPKTVMAQQRRPISSSTVMHVHECLGATSFDHESRCAFDMSSSTYPALLVEPTNTICRPFGCMHKNHNNSPPKVPSTCASVNNSHTLYAFLHPLSSWLEFLVENQIIQKQINTCKDLCTTHASNHHVRKP